MYEKVVAWDTETTGFARFEGDLVFSYSFTDIYTGETRIYRLPLLPYEEWLEQVVAHDWHPLETPFFKETYSRHDNYLRLQEFFSDTSIVKTAHNHKFDLGFARAIGIQVPDETVIHCTMLMSQAIMNLATSHALDEQAYYIFKYPLEQDDEVAKITKMLQASQSRADKKAKHIRRIYKSCYQDVPTQIMDRYQIADGERAALLYKALSKKLFGQPAQWSDYLGDASLLLPTIRQEEYGLRLDDRKNDKLITRIKAEFAKAQKDLNAAVKRAFPKDFPDGVNPKSTPQLRKLVVDCMGYELTKKTKSGGISVDGEVMGQLLDQTGDPMFDNIIKCVAYKTGITMLESYTELAHPTDRKIHANHKTNQARTGRQSVSEPNLQNIAKEKSASRYPIPARQCFSADPGWVLWMPDYAGIELRLIADVAGETEYLQAIAGQHPQGFEDAHALSCSVVYGEQWSYIEELLKNPTGMPIPEWMHKAFAVLGKGEDIKNLRKQMRNGVKNYVFGTAYGGRLEKTGANLLTLIWDEKLEAEKRFAKRFPKIAHFTENVQREVSTRGYIVTAFGRKLYIQRNGVHKSSNYTIQGTAAGPLKRAEVRVDGYGQENCGGLLREVVTVHDEMVISVNRKLLPYANYIAADVAKLMEEHRELKVKMEVEFKQTSTNWAAAKELKFPVPDDWEFGRFNINEPGYGYDF